MSTFTFSDAPSERPRDSYVAPPQHYPWAYAYPYIVDPYPATYAHPHAYTFNDAGHFTEQNYHPPALLLSSHMPATYVYPSLDAPPSFIEDGQSIGLFMRPPPGTTPRVPANLVPSLEAHPSTIEEGRSIRTFARPPPNVAPEAPTDVSLSLGALHTTIGDGQSAGLLTRHGSTPQDPVPDHETSFRQSPAAAAAAASPDPPAAASSNGNPSRRFPTNTNQFREFTVASPETLALRREMSLFDPYSTAARSHVALARYPPRETQSKYVQLLIFLVLRDPGEKLRLNASRLLAEYYRAPYFERLQLDREGTPEARRLKAEYKQTLVAMKAARIKYVTFEKANSHY